jgi:ppGpp synthetase/RelA/SpoT-type nucleotidyltranferase
MPERSVEDRLREEYFDLLPDIRHVAEHLETEVRHSVLPILRRLDRYEQLSVRSRIKECDSALEALRRRQEGDTFDRDRPELYTLTALNDLAGVRVLAFPRELLLEIDAELRGQFPIWTPDPVPGIDENGKPLAFKYHGFCEASSDVKGEVQIVSMLIGLFWEVEHSAIYKPAPQFKYIPRSPEMRDRTAEVYRALRSFEETLETLVRSA